MAQYSNRKWSATLHIRHVARTSGAPLADLRAVLDEPSARRAAGCIRDRIRGRGHSCTWREATVRVERAQAALRDWRYDHARGEARRRRARLAPPLSIDERTVRQIERLTSLASLGGSYSGSTDYSVVSVRHAEPSAARTDTSRGKRYSGTTAWCRTNAHHKYRLSLSRIVHAKRAGLPPSIDGCAVVGGELLAGARWSAWDNASVETSPTVYRVELLEPVRKRVRLRHAYVADQGGGWWHLANTLRGARTAWHLAQGSRRWAHGSTLITLARCRAWGWCAQGIRAWCQEHGITRRLSRRTTTAAALARLIGRHGGPTSSYDQHLVDLA
jgi:hypothetical protein